MTNEEELDLVITEIRRKRMEMKVSQSELAERADFSQSFLANLESGKKKPSVMTIIRIASALGISPREFFPEGAARTGSESRAETKREIMRLVETL